MRNVFGDYTLDPQRRELRCREVLIHLRPKVFDVLASLVEHRDHVATKKELLAHLWPDQYLSEATLTACIKLGRQPLADRGRHRWCIQTLHGRGYRYVAEVRVQPDTPSGAVSSPISSSAWPCTAQR